MFRRAIRWVKTIFLDAPQSHVKYGSERSTVEASHSAFTELNAKLSNSMAARKGANAAFSLDCMNWSHKVSAWSANVATGGENSRDAEKWHFFQNQECTLGFSVAMRNKKAKNAHKQPPVDLRWSRMLPYRSSHAAFAFRKGFFSCPSRRPAGKGRRQLFVVNSFSQEPHLAHETRWRFSIRCMWMQS